MIKRELAIFLVVGILTVIVDFVSYLGLSRFEVMPIGIAKATGFLVGTLFAYFANRYWTFGHKQHGLGSAYRFVFLYAATLGSNVLINAFALKIFANAVASFQLSFLLATGVSACLNFIGMKLFVFKTIQTSVG